MIREKIILAGGTGFIGRYLEACFIKDGCEVIVISRGTGQVSWEDTAGMIHALEGASMLINLAGKSVDCRYTPANKETILKSRTETTKALGHAIAKCKTPPVLWINSSTATIYRYAEDRPMTEEQGETGKGFSVNVAQAWEESFFSFSFAATRQAALRIAIVLGKDGGVLRPYTRMVRYGMGGRQGSGRQMFSWIHIEDLYRIIRFVQQHPELNGAINCAAPGPVPNSELMGSLRKAMGIPFGLPAPVWLLKAGAVLIKTETELVLKSRWVLPERLTRAGFSFRFSNLEDALANLLPE